MNIYNARCFGTDSDSGNEAIIVENCDLSIKERLLFAQQKNKSACVFLQHTNSDAVIELDYYYPHKQSPLCLHGALAAAYIYFLYHPLISSLTIINSMTRQKVLAEKIENAVFLTVTPQNIEHLSVQFDDKLVRKLLNIDSSSRIVEYYIASCGSPKLFIEFSDLQLLYSLHPDLKLICEWSKLNQLNGLYTYCRLSENCYYGRNFNHLNPTLEDAATGVAATAISYHLKKDLTVHQGITTNNNCIMHIKFLGNSVQINGRVNLYDDVPFA